MRFGYTKGCDQWVGFFQLLLTNSDPSAQLPQSPHELVNGYDCDVFFYTYENAKDRLRCKPNTRFIFISGECYNVRQFPCALLIDCKHGYQRCANSSFVYYPFYALSFFERPRYRPEQLIKSSTTMSISDRDVLPLASPCNASSVKSKFCAFMYKQEVPFRVELFDQISRYKPVDALGKSRNKNRQVVTDRHSNGFMDNAVRKYIPYKFVICCENKCHTGYITEKIINAMLAGAIPIYLGAPDISNHFNPKSFINVGAFANRGDALRYIKAVDTDPVLYNAMVSEPWFHNNTLSEYFDPLYLKKAFESTVLNKSK